MSKTLLTLGTNPDVGVATAIRFAQAGYRIVLVSGSPHEGNAGAAAISRAVRGAEVLTAVVDLADPVQVASLLLCFGTEIDVLQYHASTLRDVSAPRGNAIGAQSVDSIDEDICRDVTSVLAAIHAVLPMMRVRGSGSILLGASGLAAAPDATQLTRSVGDAAVEAMVRALSPPLAEKGVHIAVVDGKAALPDAAAVAEACWQLHVAPREAWRKTPSTRVGADSR